MKNPEVELRVGARIEEKADEKREEYSDFKNHDWCYLTERCESPIEMLLGGYLILSDDGYRDVKFYADWPTDRWPHFGTIMGCQIPIGQYRADFLFRCCFEGDYRYLVVECDGHDFHEKTKAQASRDKARDRWFSLQRIHVLRFSGSDIWKDPQSCVEQVSLALAGQIDDMFSAKDGGTSRRSDPVAKGT